jgi:hypothetical protein
LNDYVVVTTSRSSEKAKNCSKVKETIHILKDFSTRNPMVQAVWTDSKWLKSYGISKIKIMAETLKTRVPHPNDSV